MVLIERLKIHLHDCLRAADMSNDSVLSTNQLEDLADCLRAASIELVQWERKAAADTDLLDKIRDAMGGGAYDTIPVRIRKLQEMNTNKGES